MQGRRKYGTHDNHLVILTYAWKEPIRRKARNFSGTKVGEERKLWRGVLSTEKSRGAFANLSLFEDAIVLAYWLDRTQFLILFPRDTLKFFSSPSITLIHLRKKWFIENGAQSFIELNSRWKYVTMIQYLSTVAKTISIFIYISISYKKNIPIMYIYIFYSFFLICVKSDFVNLHLFILLHFTIRILRIPWHFYMLIFLLLMCVSFPLFDSTCFQFKRLKWISC